MGKNCKTAPIIASMVVLAFAAYLAAYLGSSDAFADEDSLTFYRIFDAELVANAFRPLAHIEAILRRKRVVLLTEGENGFSPEVYATSRGDGADTP
jgi:hypothetical protein